MIGERVVGIWNSPDPLKKSRKLVENDRGIVAQLIARQWFLPLNRRVSNESTDSGSSGRA